jgi:hypothetical protein
MVKVKIKILIIKDTKTNLLAVVYNQLTVWTTLRVLIYPIHARIFSQKKGILTVKT